MSENIVELTAADFDSRVASGVTLVDFWAPWCGPCRMQAPILEKLAAKVAGTARIGKLNVDDHGDVAAWFGIRGIPTMILFKDGKEVQRMVGVQPEPLLLSAIESA
jgi:thioredoxin 1